MYCSIVYIMSIRLIFLLAVSIFRSHYKKEHPGTEKYSYILLNLLTVVTVLEKNRTKVLLQFAVWLHRHHWIHEVLLYLYFILNFNHILQISSGPRLDVNKNWPNTLLEGTLGISLRKETKLALFPSLNWWICPRSKKLLYKWLLFFSSILWWMDIHWGAFFS